MATHLPPPDQSDAESHSLVLDTFPLGAQWPTADPFLFCVHHNDAYPAGTADFGPDPALLAGREMGADFAGIDGWRMYHGDVVPGFPAHPHRGFETVTYVRRGMIDHADSLGAGARFGRGDAQWLTAGSGIVHAEMFPLLRSEDPNPLELFQIWLNLPASSKMVAPYFTMLWDGDIPRVVTDAIETGDSATERTAQPKAVVTVIAGRLGMARPSAPPPDSWAADDTNEVAIWHVVLEAGASWSMPAMHSSPANRTLYVFDGDGELDVGAGAATVGAPTGVSVNPSQRIRLSARGGRVEALVLQGRPIGQPVVQHGPFVMTNRAEIQQAIQDYQRTRFGGWPWPTAGPVHGDRTRPRFARHPDGNVVTPSP